VSAALDRAGLAHVPDPIVLDITGSTNTDALRIAEAGAAHLSVVAAREQTAGRGRLDREWIASRDDCLMFSVVLRTPTYWTADVIGWIPHIAGVAVAQACSDLGLRVALKWPNDVVVIGSGPDGSQLLRKLGGLLAQRVADAVVVGVGLNVEMSQGQLPLETATSFLAQGVPGVSQADLLALSIANIAQLWDIQERWGRPGIAAEIRARYIELSASIGQRVRVEQVSGDPLVGEAIDVDHLGRLVVVSVLGVSHAISVGDVVHLRNHK